jgi:hypothetical protein
VINHEYQDRPAAISSITYTGAVPNVIATATTKTPHGRSTGDWAVITGATVLGSDDNPFNGSYTITVLDGLRFQYTMKLDPGASPTGDMWVGKSSGRPIAIKYDPSVPDAYNPGEQGVSISGAGPWTVTIITEKPHLRVPGESVCIRGVTVAGNYSNVVNDLFPVSTRENPKKLTFLVDTNPQTPDTVQARGAQINCTSAGITADGGARAIVERNRIFNTDNALYHDTFGTKDFIVRENYCSGVITGVFENMGSGTQRATSGLTQVAGVATFTTWKPHGLSVGASVTIAGAIVNSSYSNAFNGTFTVISTPSTTKFSVTLLSDPGQNASGSPVFTVTPAIPFSGTLVRYGPDHTISVFTTAVAHGFVAGDLVSVFGAYLNTSILNPFNGVFEVLASPAPTTLTFYYRMASDPGADPSPASASCWAASATPASGSGTVATFTTLTRHTLEIGQGIVVTGGGAPYDGGFAIQAVPLPETLVYNLSSTPSGNALPRAAFISLWQIGLLIAERNVIDLVLNLLRSGWGPPRGLYFIGSGNAAPYVLRSAIARRNIIRTLDGLLDTSQLPIGLQLDSCENAIIEGNFVNLNTLTALFQNTACGPLKYFNDRSATGILLQGYVFGPQSNFVNELQTATDLAASLSY